MKSVFKIVLKVVTLISAVWSQTLYHEKGNERHTSMLALIRTELIEIKKASLVYESEQRVLKEVVMRVEKDVDKINNFLLSYNTSSTATDSTNVLAAEPMDCADILLKYPDTKGKDGVYNISISSNKSVSVFCDMSTDNGGWMVIQRRIDGTLDFFRNWTDYKSGFGNVQQEFWLGNELLYSITTERPQLRVDVESFAEEKAYAVYSNFSVGDEASKYKLEVGGYSGTAGDSMFENNNVKFSTPDQDNDEYIYSNCATDRRAGWWHKSCTYTNPNGVYSNTETNGGQYITWWHWRKAYTSLKSIQLMIRPLS